MVKSHLVYGIMGVVWVFIETGLNRSQTGSIAHVKSGLLKLTIADSQIGSVRIRHVQSESRGLKQQSGQSKCLQNGWPIFTAVENLEFA